MVSLRELLESDEGIANIPHLHAKGEIDVESHFELADYAFFRHMWSVLGTTVGDILGTNQHLEGGDETLRVLCGVVFLVDAFVKDEARKPSKTLFGILSSLHDVLLILPNTAGGDELKDAVARVCERWWTQAKPGRENLVPQTLCYLLVRALSPIAKPRDVKRVAGLRAALCLFDLQDVAAAGSVRQLLLRTLVSPLFLGSSHGVKFMGHLLATCGEFGDEVHATIAGQIPVAKTAALNAYGEVYFRAWKGATTSARDTIEYSYVQELMNACVHASSKGMAAGLRTVLGAFHERKRYPGVDAALLRLYEPILWRALRAANPAVRRNAAHVLVEAFPLQNPSASNADTDANMQRQFDALHALLTDDAVAVRVVGVHGVARVLSIFWELVPRTTISALLRVVVGSLAFDASAPAVRVAVCQALGFLLDNHLAQPVLRPALPRLAPLLNDRSEAVRVAFVELLLVVKSLRSIKFWDIVPVDELLARLASDSERVSKRLVKVLSATYFPTQSSSSLLQRVVVFARQNPSAAAVFYGRVYGCGTVGLPDVASLVEDLHVLIDTAVSASLARSSEPSLIVSDAGAGYVSIMATDLDGDELELDAGRGAKRRKTAKSSSCARPVELLSTEETEVLAGLMVVAAALRNSIAGDLASVGAYAPIAARLSSLHSRSSLAGAFAWGEAHDAMAAVLALAATVPEAQLGSLADASLSALVATERDAPAAVWTPHLMCLLQWGCVTPVFDAIAQGLAAVLDDFAGGMMTLPPASAAGNSGAVKRARGSASSSSTSLPSGATGMTTRSRAPAAATPMDAVFALRVLCTMLETPTARDIVLSEAHVAHVYRLVELLGVLPAHLADALGGPGGADAETLEFCVRGGLASLRLAIHKQVSRAGRRPGSSVSWASPPREVIDALEGLVNGAMGSALATLGATGLSAGGAAVAGAGTKRGREPDTDRATGSVSSSTMARIVGDYVCGVLNIGLDALTVGMRGSHFNATLCEVVCRVGSAPWAAGLAAEVGAAAGRLLFQEFECGAELETALGFTRKVVRALPREGVAALRGPLGSVLALYARHDRVSVVMPTLVRVALSSAVGTIPSGPGRVLDTLDVSGGRSALGDVSGGGNNGGGATAGIAAALKASDVAALAELRLGDTEETPLPAAAELVVDAAGRTSTAAEAFLAELCTAARAAANGRQVYVLAHVVATLAKNMDTHPQVVRRAAEALRVCVSKLPSDAMVLVKDYERVLRGLSAAAVALA